MSSIRIQLFLSLCAGAVALAQQPAPSNPANVIHGHGTSSSISKFVGLHKIQDSGLVEANGKISTTESITSGPLEADAHDSNKIGVLGQNFAPAGEAIGTWGITYSTEGVGVRGTFAPGSGSGVGVLGDTASVDSIGGEFANTTQSGGGVGGFGYVTSPDGGIGLYGRAWSTTGSGVGVKGETYTPDGVAGAFDNTAGGNILIGLVSGSARFRVDGTGKTFADGGFQMGGADFAESIDVSGDRTLYGPGDLLAIDPSGKRRLSQTNEAYSTLVAGVYSTKPGLLGSVHPMDDPSFVSEVPLAVMGIVPCKVTTEGGPIHTGDLLVSSSSPGYAMKGTERGRMLGAVVGKALEPLSAGSSVIQVLITLQ